jgi:hypothetical protein
MQLRSGTTGSDIKNQSKVAHAGLLPRALTVRSAFGGAHTGGVA